MRTLLLVVAAAGCGGAQTQSEAEARAGKPITSAELRPNPDGGAPMVAPNRLEPLRIAGSPNIEPDDMHSLRSTYRFCVDVTGKVGDIVPVQASGDGRYDAKIEREMQHWAYHPVIVGSEPTPVCSKITFIYNHR
jgi:hypothetical protein